MAETKEPIALPPLDQRQNDKAMESLRAGQASRRVQHENGERLAEGPVVRQLVTGPDDKTHGADGGGLASEDIRKRSYVPH